MEWREQEQSTSQEHIIISIWLCVFISADWAGRGGAVEGVRAMINFTLCVNDNLMAQGIDESMHLLAIGKNNYKYVLFL